SLQATATAHNLTLSTLPDRNPGKYTRHTYYQQRQLLTSEEEDFLAEWILEQDRQGLPPTHICACEMAQKIRRTHSDIKPL
ncbi:DNA-binding domain-containing protein, partial [Aspergillus glaucus CBS 516.65]